MTNRNGGESVSEIELIYSEYCQSVSSAGKTVRLEIYGSGQNNWVLEVVDEYGNSTVWDDSFDTDEAAFQEFKRKLELEGIEAMIGSPSYAKKSQ